ncbi:hypothetical protein RND81_06G137600 [Saponaria officinalis]|uniref:Uncharacterized protein n=1 Tax=Saponaria officinalis TaxID=3572 RepID=A0AAW1K9K9_SAPOF
MESPSRALTLSPPPPPSLYKHETADSPEFEFWNSARNNPEPVHSADELFSDGYLLPLHPLTIFRSEPGPDLSEPVEPDISPEPSALISSSVSSNGNSVLSASKRWREIFKRSEKRITVDDKTGHLEESKCEKVDNRREKNRRKKTGSGSAELNINLWPFSRSQSAGNNATRSNKPEKSNRKVSSAPCSRSNSSGESKLSRRSWPGSPSRPGVHLGRASPVWQAKKAGPGSRASLGGKADAQACVGYRQRVRCGGDENGAVVGGGGGSGGTRVKSGGGNGNLFGLRGLFGKKSSTVLTV